MTEQKAREIMDVMGMELAISTMCEMNLEFFKKLRQRTFRNIEIEPSWNNEEKELLKKEFDTRWPYQKGIEDFEKFKREE